MVEISETRLALITKNLGYIAIIDRTLQKEINRITIPDFKSMKGISSPLISEIEGLNKQKILFFKDDEKVY